MLKPFFIKKKNIDNRLLPLATPADVGKVVGVTEDGNFTLVEAGGAGQNLPVFTVTNEEFAEIATDFGLFLNGITGLTFKRFNFTGTSVKEKVAALINSGAFLCKLNVPAVGDFTGLGWVTDSHEIFFPDLLYSFTLTGKYYRITLIFGVVDNTGSVGVLAEPYTMANT